MKKLLAKIMVLVLVFNMIPDFLLTQMVFGATTNLNIQAAYDKNLASQVGTDSPGLNTTPALIPKNLVTLDFSSDYTNINTGITLNYAVNENTIVKVKFLINDTNYYEVHPEIWKFASGAWAKSPFQPMVYSTVSNNTFADAFTYATSKTNLSDHQLLDTSNQIPTAAASTTDYHFKIKKNEGIGFKYDNLEVYLRHNAVTNMFTYTTNMIHGGYVYDFVLTDAAAPAVPAPTASNQVKVYTGLNMDRVDFIPLANRAAGGYSILNNTTYNDVSPIKNNKYVLNNPTAADPASADVGMAIRFDEPMAYDLSNYLSGMASNSVPVNQVNSGNYKVSFNLKMNHNLEAVNSSMRLELPNILHSSLTTTPKVVTTVGGQLYTTLPPIMATSADCRVRYVATPPTGQPRRIEIRMLNLLDGMLFDNVIIQSSLEQVAPSSEKIANNIAGNTVPFGKAFTFLKYAFLYDGVDFKIEFTPYRGYSGAYRLVKSPNASPTYISAMVESQGYISINLTDLLQDEYYVEFLPDSIASVGNLGWDNAIYSETSFYAPLDAPLVPGPARNFKIEDYILKAKPYYVSDTQFGTTGLLDLKLSWQIAYEFAVKRWFTLNPGTPGSPSHLDVDYNLVKSFTDTKEDSVEYAHVKLQIKENPAGSGFYEADYQIYDIADEGSYGSATPLATGTVPLVVEDLRLKIELDIEKIPAERSINASINLKEYKFYYEKIYYLGVETLPPALNNVKKMSLFDSMTLSDIIPMEVPPVRDLKESDNLKDTTKLGFSWAIPSEQLHHYYRRYSYLPENDIYRYNILISQDEDAIKALASKSYDQISSSLDKYSYVSTAGDGHFNIGLSNDQLSKLRDDKVILIEEVQENISSETTEFADAVKNKIDFRKSVQVLNADKNQKYYVYVILEILHEYEDASLVPQHKIRQSKVSNLLGITTKDDKNPPDGEDKRPPAPKIEIKDIEIDTATVFWQYADKPAAGSNEIIYYEIIRTRGAQIDEKYMDTYENMTDFYKILKDKMPGTEKEFLRTPLAGAGNPPEVFNGTSFSPSQQADYEITYTTEELLIKDKTLSSNSIYFYYVRTVKITNGGKTIYSVWNNATCTTFTVAPPIDLKVETEATGYDPKTEIVISFDAPLTNLSTLGTEYDLEYAIKEDNGDYSLPIQMNASTLKQNASDSLKEDYIHFIYKLSGLKPNTSYSIKVRLINIKSKDTSVWSNVVITRTQMDQEGYFNDKEVDAWMDYYKEQLSLLIQKDYWVTQTSNSKFTAVYRPSMFAELTESSDTAAIITPVGNVEKGTLTYYIDASSFAKANVSKIGFSIANTDVHVTTFPNIINLDLSEDVKKMTDKISKDNLKDYYVVITVEFKNYTNKINNADPLTPEISLRLSLSGSNKGAVDWDNGRLLEFINLIEGEMKKTAVRKRIYDMLESKKSNEDILKYVTGLVDTFEKNMASKNESAFKKVIKNTDRIQNFDTYAVIGLKNHDPALAVQGYSLTPSPAQMELIQYGAGKALYARASGSYIFAGARIVLQGFPNQPNQGITYGIISKYGLTDFLGNGGNIDTASNATRIMVLNSAVRMMGAPNGSDPVQYLKSKGYNISGANTDSIATAQETIHLVMAVYEIKTNTKASSIKVRNYAVLANVSGINQQYKQSIYAAYEIGLYGKTPFQPKNAVTIKELLDMLTALDNRAKL